MFGKVSANRAQMQIYLQFAEASVGLEFLELSEFLEFSEFLEQFTTIKTFSKLLLPSLIAPR